MPKFFKICCLMIGMMSLNPTQSLGQHCGFDCGYILMLDLVDMDSTLTKEYPMKLLWKKETYYPVRLYPYHGPSEYAFDFYAYKFRFMKAGIWFAIVPGCPLDFSEVTLEVYQTQGNGNRIWMHNFVISTEHLQALCTNNLELWNGHINPLKISILKK